MNGLLKSMDRFAHRPVPAAEMPVAQIAPRHLALVAIMLAALPCHSAQTTDDGPRHVVSLDGTWQIAAGAMDQAPTTFERTLPVPGLVSLAAPAFDPPPGPTVSDQLNPGSTDPAHAAFWYRRTFRLDQPIPSIARLKIQKAMFGTRVVLNGQVLGDHVPNFTPGYFDARAALRQGENVLLIRIGADRADTPAGMPSGFDYEKTRYIPGIFDSVDLILSGAPYFLTVQAVPDIGQQAVRVRAMLRNDAATEATVTFLVREAVSGRIVGEERRALPAGAAGETAVDALIPLSDCRLWSPESPFLYRLEADCGADRITTRFGMREFRLDPATHRAMLNGRPYFMRGSNITLYRFFEDSECKDLPWRSDWVRLLHKRVKEMHWNCLRYSLGFPPEAWYDMADEMGILIQDEFPLWNPNEATKEELEREYADWMRERWNHPCVVIWTSQNETRTLATGEALAAVRGLDLSNRPWDNGFGMPIMAPTDSFGAHAYFFSNPCARLADFAHRSKVPFGGPMDDDGTHVVIMNEYGWLWLSRDGSPTTLTRDLYRNLAGENSTAEQRRHIYATYLAADTEFWRSHRRTAAVMQFAMLAYSRPNGQTSDNWRDVQKLEWDPEFHRYVRDAFAPVGLMVDYWSGTGIGGKPARIPVRLINDLEKSWSGPVTLRLRGKDGGLLVEKRQDCQLEPYGNAAIEFAFPWPDQAGAGTLEAELTGTDGDPVRSVREVKIVDAPSLGLAFGRKAFASSSWNSAEGPENAVDGDPSTCWSSASSDPSWLAVDLGETRKISRVRIDWGVEYSWGMEYSFDFAIQVSGDAENWTDVITAANDKTVVTDVRIAPVDARFVRVLATRSHLAKPGAKNEGIPKRSYSIRELQVFE
jgi:hypothetical protein